MANSSKVPPVPRMLARLTGARLCYGRPVSANGRTVIPVASVRTMGGGGFGAGPDRGDGSGGGGGGALDARPIGFIEISSDGTRFERIDDGRAAIRALAAVSVAVIVTGRALTRRRRRLPRDAVRGALRGRRRSALPPAPPPPPPLPVRRGLLRRGAPGRRQLPHTSHRS